MNKKEFISYVFDANKEAFKEKFEDIPFTKKLTGEFLDMFLTGLTDALAEGNEVKITGFGAFHTVTSKPRELKIPTTGEVIVTKPKKVVKFKTGNVLKEAVQ